MSTVRAGFAIALSALLGACGDDGKPEREAVDLILYNGIVLTLDDANTHGTAIAIRGDRVVAVGDEQLLQTYDADDEQDLGGRTLLPGFIDTLVHVGGTPRRHVDLNAVRSVREIRERIAAKAAELGPGEWITGAGWPEAGLEEQRGPLGRDLDEAAPDNPVVLTRAGERSAVASSRALALAGIDDRTPQRAGGTIEKDQAGKLNGVIRERPDLVTRLVPKTSDAELRPSFVASLEDLFRLGITSIVQDADTITHYPEWERVYAEHRGSLPRASVQVAWEGDEAMHAFGRHTGAGDEHLKVGAIDVYVDGDFQGPSAWVREPYKAMGDYRGNLRLPPADLYDLIRDAHRAGWQLAVNATGDAAVELAAEALAEVLAETPRADHRHHLNHFTLMPSTETLGLLADNGIAITQQPNFTYTLEGRYAASLDDQRIETANPLRTLMNHGIRVALSSDMQPVGPLVGLYAAVTRKGASGRVFGPDERITMLEALREYTAAGAWLTHEEALKGTLEPGKLADFIVLSHNPLKIPEEQILSVRVLQTWLGGQLVWSNPEQGDSA